MAVVFTYGGTVVTFGRDPDVGDITIRRDLHTAKTRSASGVFYCYAKDLSKDLRTLRWTRMKAADFASLLTFLDAVDGAANSFTYTDAEGDNYTARIWNSDEIRSTPPYYGTEEVTIVLLVNN